MENNNHFIRTDTDNLPADTAVSINGKVAHVWQTYRNALRDKPYFFLTAAFIVPMLLMALIYTAMTVYPFGENSVLVLDLNGQYVNFFVELRTKLLSGGSLLYSWTRALGGEFMGIFAYYLASPFSLLVALFPADHITEALYLIILLKTGCCGLAMAFYLKKSHPAPHINIVIFSTMYAMCSFAVVQAHNTMWIDELIFLPLLVYGIEQLIKRRLFILYTVVLAACCMCSFYIGFMMCIFTFFYFFYYYFSRNDKDENNFYGEDYHFIRTMLRIGVFSALALGIALIIILPAYHSLTFGKTTFSSPSYEFVQKFDFADLLAKLFPASYDTVRPEGLPMIYCGTLTLFMLPFYFISRSVKIREKIFGGLLIAVLVFSFNGSTIDLFWHGMQKPNWLNYRYSFMLVFVMVCFAYRAFCELKKIDYRHVVAVGGALVALLVFLQTREYEWMDDLKCVWVALAFIGAYLIILNIVRYDRLQQHSALVLAALVCVEMFISGICDITDFDADVHYTSRTSYVSFFDKVQPATDAIKQYDADTYNSEFYRMEKTMRRKTNDNMTLGLYGLSNSTSTLNKSVINLLSDYGYSAKSHWAVYVGGNPVADSLFGIKYVLSENQLQSNIYRQIFDIDSSLYGISYENPYALSLAYAVNSSVANMNFSSESMSPMIRMNELIGNMLGLDEPVELFHALDSESEYFNLDVTYTSGHKKFTPTASGKESSITFTFTAENSDEIFCFFPSTWKRKVTMTLNGEDIGNFFVDDTYCIKSLGSHHAGDEMTLTMTLGDTNLYIASDTPYFFYLDSVLFTETFDELAKGNLNITSFSDTHIEGNINVSDDRTLIYTTIPYDDGWNVTVDGEKADTLKTTDDSLLAFYAVAGEHDIVLDYMPRSFVVGATVSAVCTAIFIAAAVTSLIRRKKLKKREADEAKAVLDMAVSQRTIY